MKLHALHVILIQVINWLEVNVNAYRDMYNKQHAIVIQFQYFFKNAIIHVWSAQEQLVATVLNVIAQEHFN